MGRIADFGSDHPVFKSGTGASLRRMAGEMARISRSLQSLGEQIEPNSSQPSDVQASAAGSDSRLIRAELRTRRMRDDYFPPDLFADPAWDMLLDLMAARLEGRLVSVSSLTIAAAVPATTALRWIKILVDRGLLVRARHQTDARIIYVSLTDEAADAMRAYLTAKARLTG